MNFSGWYTDTADVYRVTATTTNYLTKNTLTKIYEAIPCRIYQDGASAPSMSQDAAKISQNLKVAMSNDYTIHAGDKLVITRGGKLGKSTSVTTAYAGDPHIHYEPFGAVMPQLAHQEIALLQEERNS